MRTSNRTIFFDTNILIYNQDQDSSFYQQALDYHQKVMTGKIRGVISSQNLLEFSAVMTNPKKITKSLSQKIVALEINKYLKSPFTIIYPKQETLSIFVKLIKKYRLSNPKHVFDFFLIATMLSYNITHILTINDKDFLLFKEIKVIKLEN